MLVAAFQLALMIAKRSSYWLVERILMALISRAMCMPAPILRVVIFGGDLLTELRYRLAQFELPFLRLTSTQQNCRKSSPSASIKAL